MGEIKKTQKPQWCFEHIEHNNKHLIILQAIISSNYATIYANDKIISTFRIFAGYENIFYFTLHDQKFSLTLHKKPVGGFDYSLETIEGKKLDAYESNPTVAVSHHAKKVAESTATETLTRAPWFILGILSGAGLAAIFGGPLAIFCGMCFGVVYVLIVILIRESGRIKSEEIFLLIVVTGLFVAIVILLDPFFDLIGLHKVPRWYM